jgi:type IV pilus assembly protein PilA
MKHLNLKNTAAKGFSLVEMLVVIAVIGVIAAIAIPSIGSINASAQTATAQRNAQSVVSMYTAGSAAGVVWAGGAVRNDKIAAVVAGDSPPNGAFVGKIFKVPNLALADQQASYIYIGIDANNDLFYDKAGTQSST